VRPGTVAYLSGARSMVRTVDGETVRPWQPIDVPPGGGMMAYNQSAYLNLGGGVRLVAICKVDPGRRYSVSVLRPEDDGDHWSCLPLAIGDDRLSSGPFPARRETPSHRSASVEVKLTSGGSGVAEQGSDREPSRPVGG